MRKLKSDEVNRYTQQSSELCYHNNCINDELFDQYHVLRGLRDKKGHGVIAGITNISKVEGRRIVDGKEELCEGLLLYRGYNVIDLIRNCAKEQRYGFEEVTYLLLFGQLPTRAQLEEIAQKKMDQLNAIDLDGAVKIVAGTARSMGVTVEG